MRLTVFMKGPIMSHQECGGHENAKAYKRQKKQTPLSCVGGERRRRRRCEQIRLSEGRPVSRLKDRSSGRRRGNRCGASEHQCKLD